MRIWRTVIAPAILTIGTACALVAGPVLAGLGLLLICPTAHGFDFATHLLPGRLVLAAGLVLTITPLSSVVLLAVEPAHSGVAAAIQNAVGRTSALTAIACVGLIAAGPLTDGSFTRLLEVAAGLYFVGAVVGCVTVTDPIAVAEPVAAKLPPGDTAAATPAPVWPAAPEPQRPPQLRGMTLQRHLRHAEVSARAQRSR